MLWSELNAVEDEFRQSLSPATRRIYGGLILPTFSAIAVSEPRIEFDGPYRLVRGFEKAGLVEYVRRVEEVEGDWRAGKWATVKRGIPFLDPSDYIRLTQRGLDVYNGLREAGCVDAKENVAEIRPFYVPWLRRSHYAFD
jgi:hypothetical protein